jgi:hypothetical protein
VDRGAGVPAGLLASVIFGVCREINEKAKLFFKDELQNFVAAVR